MITCETTKYNFLNTLSPLISLHFNRHHLKKIQATKKNGVKMLQNTTSMGTQKKIPLRQQYRIVDTARIQTRQCLRHDKTPTTD